MKQLTIAMFMSFLLVAACSSDSSDLPASSETEIGGACFASCGAGISTCYSGPEMSASECQSIASDMCPENIKAEFVLSCECSDDPMQGPDNC